jgi:uncharacterized membrane protein HdeD (DUF308 family)
MAGGLASIMSQFRGRRGRSVSIWSLLIGIVITFVGARIFVNPENFASIIPSAVGYLITFSGIMNLLETFTLSRAHYRKWWVSLLAALMTIVLGLILINHALGIAETMVRIGGIALLFNGASDLWISRRVGQYAGSRRRNSRSSGGSRSARAEGGGTARYDTSGPEIIDADSDDYREL